MVFPMLGQRFFGGHSEGHDFRPHGVGSTSRVLVFFNGDPMGFCNDIHQTIANNILDHGRGIFMDLTPQYLTPKCMTM